MLLRIAVMILSFDQNASSWVVREHVRNLKSAIHACSGRRVQTQSYACVVEEKSTIFSQQKPSQQHYRRSLVIESFSCSQREEFTNCVAELKQPEPALNIHDAAARPQPQSQSFQSLFHSLSIIKFRCRLERSRCGFLVENSILTRKL
jgi:hypothetical protein